MIANRTKIKKWANRSKCWMCKHKFETTVLLPVKSPQRDKFQPNINPEVLYHLKDTHGLEPYIVSEWIIGSIYDQKLTLFGVKR